MTFFAKVEAKLKEFFTKAPTWESVAAETLKFAAPLTETIVGLVDPAAVPAVTALVTKIQTGLAAAAVTLEDAGASPTLASGLSAVTSNLSALEAAAQIKDPATAAKLTATVTTLTGEVGAILSAIPAA